MIACSNEFFYSLSLKIYLEVYLISEETIKKVAGLARLELSAEEVTLYSKQLGGILEYVSQLSKVNTDNVLPLVTATDMAQTFNNDVIEKCGDPESVTKNAPDHSGNLYKVPAVL
jgi:aspartyl-tRNA(Asn)/glutamyl-tRNA(Gln) amidotransferase subunit C